MEALPDADWRNSNLLHSSHSCSALRQMYGIPIGVVACIAAAVRITPQSSSVYLNLDPPMQLIAVASRSGQMPL